jgi:ring-1,2-phenylacetyl-CoA epoxidase subunit PaaA
MDSEYKDLLGRVLTIQSDCEIGGPHLYVERMLPSAPSKVDQLIVARTAAEEIDRFRKIARLAGDIGVDVSFVLSMPNKDRYVNAFRGLITTWEEFAVFGFLIDRVGRYQLEEFYDCSYLPLQRVLPDIVTEELGHIEYGGNKTAELILKGDETKKKVQKALDFWYVTALDMFGHAEIKAIRSVSLLGSQASHQCPSARGLHPRGQPLDRANGIGGPGSAEGPKISLATTRRNQCND